MSQLSWPERYAVELRDFQGESVTYCITTWLHDRKAIALAVTHFASAHPDRRVYDVTVTALGQAPRGDQGTVAINKGDLIDRTEW